MTKLKRALRRFWRQIVHGKWVVANCSFPYKPGYGTYNRRTHTIVDTGLTYEQARAAADRLNDGEYGY